MINLKTLQSKLFTSYSIIIISLIVVFIVSFYLYSVRMLEQKASESLYQFSSNISAQLDNKFETMNSISVRVLFSEPLKKLMYLDSNEFYSSNVLLQRRFNDYIFLSKGPDNPGITQINIINTNGNFVSVGETSTLKTLLIQDIKKVFWFDKCFSLGGNRLITPPHKEIWNETGKTVVSMCRVFSDDFGTSPDSIIEVQLDYAFLVEMINTAISSGSLNSDKMNKVFVLDSEGRIIYPHPRDLPQDSIKTAKFYWGLISPDNKTTPTLNVHNPYTKDDEILAFKKSSFSGWTVIFAESEKRLFLPVDKFRNTLIYIGLIAILITMVLSYFVAKGISNPLKRMHKNMKGLKLEALPESILLEPNSGITEIEELNHVFNEMCKTLKISLEQVVSSRSHEIQARMLALQSQMNPHFLYNTLATIKIMGKETKHEGIVDICTNLSNMLRYVSGSSSKPVRLHDENEHTKSFLNLMKIRYQDKLKFEIDIEESMLDIRVPKLIVQPLVENCLKYGIDVYPPWLIKVKGALENNSWKLSVLDNGSGFDADKLQEIKNKLESIDLNDITPEIAIEGMGIINIYIRLKLLYGNDAVFYMDNMPEGGARVTIGGPIKKE